LPVYEKSLFTKSNLSLDYHSFPARAARVRRPVEVIVTADRDDWTYKPGDKVQFIVSVLRNGNPVKNAQVRYEIGLEKLDPTIKETKTAADGKITIDGGTLKTPGFLRCIAWANVDGGEYRGLATAGFDPLKIQPTRDQS
jgi:cephalosporin-C deacetylase